MIAKTNNKEKDMLRHLPNYLTLGLLILASAQAHAQPHNDITITQKLNVESDPLATQRCDDFRPSSCPAAEDILSKEEIEQVKSATNQLLSTRCEMIFGEQVQQSPIVGSFQWDHAQTQMGGYDLQYFANTECGAPYANISEWLTQALHALEQPNSYLVDRHIVAATIPFGYQVLTALTEAYPTTSDNTQRAIVRILDAVIQSSPRTAAALAGDLLSEDDDRYSLALGRLLSVKTFPSTVRALLIEAYPQVREDRKRILTDTIRRFHSINRSDSNFSEPQGRWLNQMIAKAFEPSLASEDYGVYAAWALADAGFAGRNVLRKVLEGGPEVYSAVELKAAATGVAYYVTRLSYLKRDPELKEKYSQDLWSISYELLELAMVYARSEYQLGKLREIRQFKLDARHPETSDF